MHKNFHNRNYYNHELVKKKTIKNFHEQKKIFAALIYVTFFELIVFCESIKFLLESTTAINLSLGVKIIYSFKRSFNK